MNAESETEIRRLESVEEFQAVEALQRQIWPGAESEVVPMHVLTTVAHNGGLVMGAFAPAASGQQMVGFVFGFLGTDEASPGRPAMARLKHCSHMLGVLPEYRDSGLGYRLKLAQRQFVLRQGIRLITWTYDPLESRNAYLNIAKLRTVCRTYLREVYGQMADALNAGLPSDRFQVEWWITSRRVKQELDEAAPRKTLTLESFTSAGAEILNPTTATASGLPCPSEREPLPAGRIALAEIPADFQAIKTRDMGLARAWRDHTRTLFESLFQADYLAIDFVHERLGERRRSFYVLSRGDARLGFSQN